MPTNQNNELRYKGHCIHNFTFALLVFSVHTTSGQVVVSLDVIITQ